LSVTRLNPEDLRRYARRDWAAPERLARRERARQPLALKIDIAIALYEAAKVTNPTWPDEATRRADFEAHLRLKTLLDEATDVGAR
jgi:hypothetical protein